MIVLIPGKEYLRNNLNKDLTLEYCLKTVQLKSLDLEQQIAHFQLTAKGT